MSSTDPSAALDPIRADLRAAADGGLQGVKAGDYLPAALVRHSRMLLAAVEAVLKLAGGWKAEAARLEPSGADAVQPAMPGNYLVSGRIGALEDCEGELREAVTRALSGGRGHS